MIKIDFELAISIFLFLSLSLVFFRWIFYNSFREYEIDIHTEYLTQCPVCTYIFFLYAKVQLIICPRCQSLITLNQEKDPSKKEG